MDLRRIGPHDEVRLLSDRRGELTRLELHPGTPGEAGAVYIVDRDSTGYRAWRENEPLRRVLRKYEGPIEGSLTASLKRAGILAPQVRQFCAIFDEDVDAAGVRAGDAWTMLTEEFVDPDGRLARPGRVVGGRFTSRGVAHEAFYFDPEVGAAAPPAESDGARGAFAALDMPGAAGPPGRFRGRGSTSIGTMRARCPPSRRRRAETTG